MRFLKNLMKTNNENIIHPTDCNCENCCPSCNAATFLIEKEEYGVENKPICDIIKEKEKKKHFRKCLRRKK